MLNLLRSLLLNITAIEQEGSQYPEVIDSKFTPINYSAALETIRTIILRTDTTQTEKNYIAYQVIKLVHSTELEAYLLPLEDIQTFRLDSNKFFSEAFGSLFNIATLEKSISSLGDRLNIFLDFASKYLDPEVLGPLNIIRMRHESPVWRLSAILIIWFLAADHNRKFRHVK